jgi:endoribonuclease LACTB2
LPTPTLPPATSTNTVLVGGGDFVVLDPGTPHEEPLARLYASVDKRLAAGGRLLGVALTHQHGDHWGGLEDLLARYSDRKLRVWAHARTHAEVRVVGADRRELEDGDTLDLRGLSLMALHTPGHTRGHLSFVDRRNRTAYGGDVVATEGTIIVDPPDGDMAAYLDTLARLQRLKLALLVPSHGDVVEAPNELLGWYVKHRLDREARVLAALGDALEGVETIVPRAYPEVPPMVYPLAARSLLAHLIKLGDEGRAERSGGRWRRVDALGGGPVHNP